MNQSHSQKKVLFNSSYKMQNQFLPYGRDLASTQSKVSETSLAENLLCLYFVRVFAFLADRQGYRAFQKVDSTGDGGHHIVQRKACHRQMQAARAQHSIRKLQQLRGESNWPRR